LNIALVSHEYPPFRGGGIGTYATVMAHLFAERGHEVHVVTNLYPSAIEAEHKKEHSVHGSLHVHRVPGISDGWEPPPKATALESRMHREWSPYLAYAERVAERMKSLHAEFRFDIAEFPECAAEGYGVIHRRRLGLAFTDLPTTVTLHSPIEEIYRYNFYPRQNLGFQQRKALEDATVIEADGINSPSQRLITIVRERLGIGNDDRRPWNVVRLPVDRLGHSAVPDTAGRSGDSLKILAVGRVEPRKGVIDLVDAAAPLLTQFPNLTIEFVGNECDAGLVPGPMGEFLRSRVPASARDRLILHGMRPRDELAERFADASAVVFASRWDNYPLACLEAMSVGACCVISDGVGFAEVVNHGQDAFVFPAGNIGALRECLAGVLADPSGTAPVRAEAARRAGIIADPEQMVESRLQHYQRVIESAEARSATAPRGARIGWTATGNIKTDQTVRASAEQSGSVLVDQQSPLNGADSVQTDEANGRDDVNSHSAVEFRLRVPAGDELKPEAISTLLAVMNARPDAAWVAPWTLPESTTGPMFAGLDFALPLDMLANLAPRTVLERQSAFQAITPAESAHPPAWRDLDHRLSLHEAKTPGLAVPEWLCVGAKEPDSASDANEKIDSDRSTLLLEQLLERHPEVFRRHGAALWLYRAANNGSHSDVGGLRTEPGFRGVVWLAFKAAVKKRFPRLSARIRRVLGPPR
jgi:glycosyltransferase involved in cell wall biosynthesis